MYLVNFKDANGSTVNVPNLRVMFSNMNSQPLPVAKERSRLYESVNVTTEPKTTVIKIGNALDCIVTWMFDVYYLLYRWTGTHNT